ncbi:MAG: hypothetical protein KDC98_03935 [Planctomycetes bacterium]|nr:hypothetical protein [Planctomycetota bacterium]
MKVVFATLLMLAFASAARAQLTCFSNLVASSCGPTLSVTYVPNGAAGNYDMTMTGIGLHPHSPGVFVWGAHPVNIPLPGGCALLTDYIWGHSFITDSAGVATWSRSWPHWATITFYMQMGSVQVYSNGSYTALTTELRLAGCL